MADKGEYVEKMRVLGLDGCRAGWFTVTLAPESGELTATLAANWSELVTEQGSAAMVAVDMPIGLADAGPRGCDVAARELLPRGRKSSIFPAPRRYMLDCGSWVEAQAEGRHREGCGLSKQSWNILPKIRELDAALGPADQERVREAHPELIFHHLNDWEPLPGKRSSEGREARLGLLEASGITGVEGLLNLFPRAQVQPDDVIDAAACALAARRMLLGEAVCLPENPSRDARGLSMEIWY